MWAERKAEEMELFARCASGFESVLARELRELGMRRVRPLKGGVAFFGDRADAYRACLWSRVSTRVQLVLARVAAATADELYEGVKGIEWGRHVRRGATIAVFAHGTNQGLRNTAFSALKAKDAVCDRLREALGERPDVDAHHPDLRIDVTVHETRATVYVNLSGESLHRRGYRKDGEQTEAPLKETLAAGLLMAAGWPELASQGGLLVDPMCGSGTIAVEGALMAAGVAPGLLREHWGFEGWAGHDENEWGVALAEASVADCDSEAFVLAGDIDRNAVEIARGNVARAGVGSRVQLYVDDARNLGRHVRGILKRGARPGLLVANPPYGERLGTKEGLGQVHEALGLAVDALPDGWRCALITPNASVDTALGRVPTQTIDCFNGPIEVSVRLYDDLRSRLTHTVVSLAGVQRTIALADERSTQFAARLRKVARDRMRQARREGLACIRVYDADMPEFRLSVNVYQGAAQDAGVQHAVVTEHKRPRSVKPEVAERRLADATVLVAAILDMEASNVHVCAQDGGDSRRNRNHVPLTVEEGGVLVDIELPGHPDSGLPLDQRGVRALVRELSRDRRFVSLFGPSSAASVFAAAGGATRTVSLEPFDDRAKRIRRSLSRNGLSERRHTVTRAEADEWLARARRERQTFDVVLCVPPTWKPDLDVAQIARGIDDVLAKSGTVVVAGSDAVVSTWAQCFEALGFVSRDVSDEIAQPDFARAKNRMCCLAFQRRTMRHVKSKRRQRGCRRTRS